MKSYFPIKATVVASGPHSGRELWTEQSSCKDQPLTTIAGR